MFGVVAGTLIVGLVIGYILALVFDAPSKRAIAKLKQLVGREEAYVQSLIASGYKAESDIIRGANNVIANLKNAIARLEGK